MDKQRFSGTSPGKYLSQSRNTPGRFPIPGHHGIELTDPQSAGSVWSWSYPNPRPIEHSMMSLLYQPIFTIKEVDRSLQNLRHDVDESLLLAYGPFAADWFYLSPNSLAMFNATTGINPAKRFDSAARLSHFLVRYFERAEYKHTSREIVAFAMATRTYWKAISALLDLADELWKMFDATDHSTQMFVEYVEDSDYPWLAGWLDQGVDIREEYVRASRSWQSICMDEEYAFFFIHTLCPLLCGADCDWQLLRERELNATVWRPESKNHSGAATDGSSDKLGGSLENSPSTRSPVCSWLDRTFCYPLPEGIRASTEEQRAILRQVIQRWYLSRYDLRRAAQVQAAISFHESRNPDAWWARFNRVLLRLKLGHFGAMRFWGSVGAGYLLTSLTPDVWSLLSTMVTQRCIQSLLLTALAMGATFFYLFYGINGKIGIRDRRIALDRTANLWGRGQAFSVSVGLLLAFLVGRLQIGGTSPPYQLGTIPLLPSFTLEPLYGPAPAWWQIAICGFMYAQLMIAFGVFVQLLFDEKTMTAPLDAP